MITCTTGKGLAGSRAPGELPAAAPRAVVTAFAVLCLLATARLATAEPTYTEKFNVTYVKHGDEALRCDLAIPAGDGPFPAVLVVHGGAWMSGGKWHMTRAITPLVEHGYVTCSIDYRLAPKHVFPAQIDDCKSAVRWLRSHANEFKIDPERIGGFGYSAGGQLVALLGVTDRDDGLEGPDATADSPSTRLQCVVAGGAPCDFRSMPVDSNRLAYWLGGNRAEKPLAYQQASPLNFVTADDPPIFFFHGEEDGLVPLESPRIMVQQLTASRVPASLHTIPKAGHIGAFLNPEAMTAAIEFLDKYLQPDRKPTVTSND
ncbi:MAG TPA: alpha/beta hydrolase [Pirellulales bacterium]|nr:alpha/beta hydrolase [Pirellulales bacterium]